MLAMSMRVAMLATLLPIIVQECTDAHVNFRAQWRRREFWLPMSEDGVLPRTIVTRSICADGNFELIASLPSESTRLIVTRRLATRVKEACKPITYDNPPANPFLLMLRLSSCSPNT